MLLKNIDFEVVLDTGDLDYTTNSQNKKRKIDHILSSFSMQFFSTGRTRRISLIMYNYLALNYMHLAQIHAIS